MHHEPCEQNEVFIGNTQLSGWPKPYLSSLKTARIGSQALDIDGKKIDTQYMRPMFINRSESQSYDSIMEAKLKEIRSGLN